MFTEKDKLYILLAISEAENFIGATAPNPPVGACIVKNDKVLGIGGHMRAGAAHAEIVAIENAVKNFGADAVKGSTLYVTLEPCNHIGKTPPCTEAIKAFGISKVIIGTLDPNKNVKGGGVDFLKKNKIEVAVGCAEKECRRLVAPFAKHISTGLPWIAHKLAYRVARDGSLSMVPEKGAATFTNEESLKLAHTERRKSDAILTGIGTVTSDFPKFNVRFVQDHPNRRRFLVVMSQDGIEPPQKWLEQEWDLGFEVLVVQDFDSVIAQLGAMGVQRLLVEGGPTLSMFIQDKNLWDERLTFVQHVSVLQTANGSGLVKASDYISREYRDSSLN